jgi:uncharacterized delta-60 repeat protein
LASHSYKRLCKLYGSVLRHMRTVQWLMEHGISWGISENQPAQAAVEAFEPRLMMSGGDVGPHIEQWYFTASPQTYSVASITVEFSEEVACSTGDVKLLKGTSTGLVDVTNDSNVTITRTVDPNDDCKVTWTFSGTGISTATYNYVFSLMSEYITDANENDGVVRHLNGGGEGAADGSNFVQLVPRPADATCDGYVDGGDLNLVLSNWNGTGMTWNTGDLTGNGYVDSGDLNILLSNWNSTRTFPANSQPAFASAILTSSDGYDASLTVNFTDVDSGDPHYVSVAWGDGAVDFIDLTANTFTYEFTHTYSELGDYVPSVSLDDGVNKSISMSVAPAILGPETCNEGDTVSFGSVVAVDGEPDFTWSVTKDGNSYTLPSNTVTDGTTFTFQPADNGNYVVTLDPGIEGIDPVVKTLTVANVAPTLTLSGDATTPEGASYTLNLSASDPGPDTITQWTIDWGDGSTIQTITGNPESASHTYADGPNTYHILATATDEDGTYASDALTMDTSFGDIVSGTQHSGTVVDCFAGSEQIYDVSIKADGKIVRAGSTYGSFLTLAQYLPDGTLDTSFGEDYNEDSIPDGKVIVDFGITIKCLAIQSDGKIVVAGTSGGNFVIARYNSDGSQDTTFGTSGNNYQITTDFGYTDTPSAIVIQADNKIVVAGTSGYEVALARYNTDGTLDTTFGTNGKMRTSLGGSVTRYVTDMAIQANGKIVVVGYKSSVFTVLRFESDGDLDTTFGGTGQVCTTLSEEGIDRAYSVAIQSDGKIVVAGKVNDAFTLVRYDVNGDLDETFGTNGLLTVGGSGSYARDVIIQPDGMIVATGTTGGTSGDFMTIRCDADGILDPNFGTAGILTNAFEGLDIATKLAIQPDGKIIIAGRSSGGDNYAIVRYGYTNGYVTVTNVAPQDVTISGPETRNEGQTATFTGSATDPGGDQLAYTWSVTRDGAVYTLPQETVTDESTFAFVTGEEGVYEVTLTVTDEDGGATSETYSTVVQPLSPEITDLYLVNDTGTANDGITSDPRVGGVVDSNGSLNLLPVEFDLNGDGVADGVGYTSDDNDGIFVLDLRPFITVPGQVEVSVRVARESAIADEHYVWGEWSSISFTYEPALGVDDVTSDVPTASTVAVFSSGSWRPTFTGSDGTSACDYSVDVSSLLGVFDTFANRFNPTGGQSLNISVTDADSTPTVTYSTDSFGQYTVTTVTTSSHTITSTYNGSDSWTYYESFTSYVQVVTSFAGFDGSSWEMTRTETNDYELTASRSLLSGTSYYALQDSDQHIDFDWQDASSPTHTYQYNDDETLELSADGTMTTINNQSVIEEDVDYDATGYSVVHNIESGSNADTVWDYDDANDTNWSNNVDIITTTNAQGGVTSDAEYVYGSTSTTDKESSRTITINETTSNLTKTGTEEIDYSTHMVETVGLDGYTVILPDNSSIGWNSVYYQKSIPNGSDVYDYVLNLTTEVSAEPRSGVNFCVTSVLEDVTIHREGTSAVSNHALTELANSQAVNFYQTTRDELTTIDITGGGHASSWLVVGVSEAYSSDMLYPYTDSANTTYFAALEIVDTTERVYSVDGTISLSRDVYGGVEYSGSVTKDDEIDREESTATIALQEGTLYYHAYHEGDNYVMRYGVLHETKFAMSFETVHTNTHRITESTLNADGTTEDEYEEDVIESVRTGAASYYYYHATENPFCGTGYREVKITRFKMSNSDTASHSDTANPTGVVTGRSSGTLYTCSGEDSRESTVSWSDNGTASWYTNYVKNQVDGADAIVLVQCHLNDTMGYGANYTRTFYADGDWESSDYIVYTEGMNTYSPRCGNGMMPGDVDLPSYDGGISTAYSIEALLGSVVDDIEAAAATEFFENVDILTDTANLLNHLVA